jgi:hypothetical protein
LVCVTQNLESGVKRNAEQRVGESCRIFVPSEVMESLVGLYRFAGL